MGAEQEIMAYLERLAEQQDRIERKVDQILAQRASAPASASGAAGASGPAEIASDRELDNKEWGDPPVKFNPRDWKSPNPSIKGKRMSECPPEALDVLAVAYDDFAAKNTRDGDNKKAGYDRTAARKARGWAQRLRNGWTPLLGGASQTKTADGWPSGAGGWPGTTPAAAAPAAVPADDDWGPPSDDDIPF